MPKCRICFSSNVSVEEKQQMYERLGMEEITDMEKYLGVPMVQGRMCKSLFELLISEIDQRLASWKVPLLSMAGRVTLAEKIVFASLGL